MSRCLSVPPVHLDHLRVQDVAQHLLHGNLSCVARPPAQGVGQVVPRAQRQDGDLRDEGVLALPTPNTPKEDGDRIQGCTGN